MRAQKKEKDRTDRWCGGAPFHFRSMPLHFRLLFFFLADIFFRVGLCVLGLPKQASHVCSPSHNGNTRWRPMIGSCSRLLLCGCQNRRPLDVPCLSKPFSTRDNVVTTSFPQCRIVHGRLRSADHLEKLLALPKFSVFKKLLWTANFFFLVISLVFSSLSRCQY